MTGEKRSGEAISEGTSKKSKTETSKGTIPSIPVHSALDSISIAEIDKFITKPTSDGGICTIEDLMIIEARFTSPLTQPFVPAQARLHTAQSPYHRQLLDFASDKQEKLGKKMTTDHAVLQSTRLIMLAEQPEAITRQDLRDAILYRATFMLFYGAFNCNGGGNSMGATKKFREVIEKVPVTPDPNGLVEMLVAASERHLTKKEYRSVIWKNLEDPKRPSNLPIEPAEPTEPTKTTSIPRSDSINDQWVQSKAQSLITSFEDLHLESLTAWDKIDNVSDEDKDELLVERMMRRIEPEEQDRTPPSVLLHGVQGSGKTSVVLNWCRHVKGTLIEFNAHTKGPYEGLTEQLLRYLVDKAIEIGRTSPVVLFLDEADQLLASHSDERANAIQSCIKGLFTRLEASNSEVYFFATTNTPENIKWSEGWDRRLQYKFHVQSPGVQGRTSILQHKLANLIPDIKQEQVIRLAKKLEGYSASDIGIMVKKFKGTSRKHLAKTEFWREIEESGALVLVPAKEGDFGCLESRFDDLSVEDVRRIRLDPLTAEELDRHIDRCVRRQSKTVKTAEIRQHEAWARAHARE